MRRMDRRAQKGSHFANFRDSFVSMKRCGRESETKAVASVTRGSVTCEVAQTLQVHHNSKFSCTMTNCWP